MYRDVVYKPAIPQGCRGYGVVVDGPGGYLPAMPRAMRDAGAGHPVPVLAGINSNENGMTALQGLNIIIHIIVIYITFVFYLQIRKKCLNSAKL